MEAKNTHYKNIRNFEKIIGKRITDPSRTVLEMTFPSLPRLPEPSWPESGVILQVGPAPRSPSPSQRSTGWEMGLLPTFSIAWPPSHAEREAQPAVPEAFTQTYPVGGTKSGARPSPLPRYRQATEETLLRRRERWGLGEGVHIWIPGPEPAFFPCECEEMGSLSGELRGGCWPPSCPTVTGPTLAGRLAETGRPGTSFGGPHPDCSLARAGPGWGSVPSTPASASEIPEGRRRWRPEGTGPLVGERGPGGGKVGEGGGGPLSLFYPEKRGALPGGSP